MITKCCIVIFENLFVYRAFILVAVEILIFSEGQPPISHRSYCDIVRSGQPPISHRSYCDIVCYVKCNMRLSLLLLYLGTLSNLEHQETLKILPCFCFPGYQFPDQDLDTMSPIFLKNKVF